MAPSSVHGELIGSEAKEEECDARRAVCGRGLASRTWVRAARVARKCNNCGRWSGRSSRLFAGRVGRFRWQWRGGLTLAVGKMGKTGRDREAGWEGPWGLFASQGCRDVEQGRQGLEGVLVWPKHAKHANPNHVLLCTASKRNEAPRDTLE